MTERETIIRILPQPIFPQQYSSVFTFTCFVYFNHRFGQGVWCNFGPEVHLDVRYHPLHSVAVLTCIAARGIGSTCRSRVCLDARHDEKHLDDAKDGKLQLDRTGRVHGTPIISSCYIRWVLEKSKLEAGMLWAGSGRRRCHWDHLLQAPCSQQPECREGKEQKEILPKLKLNTILIKQDNLVLTCLVSRLILATDRMAMISLNTLPLLVLALTRWHPEGLNLPIAERCCSIVFPIAGVVGPLHYLVIWKAFLESVTNFSPPYHSTCVIFYINWQKQTRFLHGSPQCSCLDLATLSARSH